MQKIKLAILQDYPEENWQSMNLCAEMLTKHLQEEHSEHFNAQAIHPIFRKQLQHLPWVRNRKGIINGDRLINRFWNYPNFLEGQVKQFNLFHITDHSYSQLVHQLPADRTGVFCHDLDTFRCLLEPQRDPRPAWFRAMARRILNGLQKAAVVFYTTEQVRQEIENYQLVDLNRLVQAPLGIAPEFSPIEHPLSPQEQQLLAAVGNKPFLLHVGTCIPRKRIDVLLNVFAQVRKKFPDLNLIKVGGSWTQEQKQQIAELQLESVIIHLHNLPRTTIAHLYRQASLILVTSESEGFGLPIIEALACGAPVVASEIPVLKEVGGAAVTYCPVGNIEVWEKNIAEILTMPSKGPNQEARQHQAQKYSWSNHANIIVQAYLKLV